MKKFVLISFALVGFSLALKAQACFEYAATACVPSNESINNKAFNQSDGAVNHSKTSVFPITLFGPVFLPVGATANNLNLKFTYKDPDETAGKCKAAVSIKSVNKRTGLVQYIVTLDSNNPPPGGDGTPGIIKTIQTAIIHNFNFNDYYYYAEISILRTNTTLRPQVIGYSICWVII